MKKVSVLSARLVAALCGLALVFAELPAYAEIACPPGISPDKPRRTQTDSIMMPVPLDERVYIEYAGTLYHIPAGYLGGFSPKHEVSTGWFTSKMVGFDMEGINTVKGINLAFWMPSLRYPERDVLSIPEFRFCEDGRPPITPDQPEYTVRIQIRSIDEARKGEYLTPLQSYKNHISRYADGERSFDFQKEYGLIRFKNKTDPDTPDTYLEYRHLENSTPEDTPELRTQQEEARRAIL